jgi:hypothetical protein
MSEGPLVTACMLELVVGAPPGRNGENRACVMVQHLGDGTSPAAYACDDEDNSVWCPRSALARQTLPRRHHISNGAIAFCINCIPAMPLDVQCACGCLCARACVRVRVCVCLCVDNVRVRLRLVRVSVCLPVRIPKENSSVQKHGRKINSAITR